MGMWNIGKRNSVLHLNSPVNFPFCVDRANVMLIRYTMRNTANRYTKSKPCLDTALAVASKHLSMGHCIVIVWRYCATQHKYFWSGNIHYGKTSLLYRMVAWSPSISSIGAWLFTLPSQPVGNLYVSWRQWSVAASQGVCIRSQKTAAIGFVLIIVGSVS